jgi:hypothetical protein
MYKKILLGYIVLLMIVIISSCHRRFYVYFPPKGWEIGCPFDDLRGCIPINPKDTMIVKERSIIGIFEIVDIELQKGVYKIGVQCDSLYKDGSQRWCEVFSIETMKMENKKKIKKGQKYKLILNPYFVHDILTDFCPRKVYIQGIPVGISTGRINIYTTQNLNGLYYIPPSD